MREIEFYKTDLNRCFIEEFLESLSDKEAKKVLWVLRLVSELEKVPTQYFKKLVNTNDIWEVRIQIGNNTFRLLGFIYSRKKLILTNGFKKKSQKTPLEEIKLAEARKKEFLERKLV